MPICRLIRLMANASYWITAGIRQLRSRMSNLLPKISGWITRDGVETVDGVMRMSKPLICIAILPVAVLATGFKVSLMTARLNVTGLSAKNLSDVWADDNPLAHLGITVPGFPNLFTIARSKHGFGPWGSAIFQSSLASRMPGALYRFIALCKCSSAGSIRLTPRHACGARRRNTYLRHDVSMSGAGRCGTRRHDLDAVAPRHVDLLPLERERPRRFGYAVAARRLSYR